jgi:hypothetical protein
LRQIFYIKDKSKNIIASQAELIALYLNIKKSTPAIEYLDAAKKKSTEYCWFLDTTAYNDIRRLLPNTYLDMSSKKISRFWPTHKQNYIEVGEAIARCSFILENNILGICNRYKPKITFNSWA